MRSTIKPNIHHNLGAFMVRKLGLCHEDDFATYFAPSQALQRLSGSYL
jgi:hypothetical protein